MLDETADDPGRDIDIDTFGHQFATAQRLEIKVFDDALAIIKCAVEFLIDNCVSGCHEHHIRPFATAHTMHDKKFQNHANTQRLPPYPP